MATSTSPRSGTGWSAGFVSVTELDDERWLQSVSASPMADPELVVAEVLRTAGAP